MSDQSQNLAYPLARAAIKSMVWAFRDFGHKPSDRMWTDLKLTAMHLEDMANGICKPKYYLNSLATGVGKTTLIMFFVGTLLRSKHHKDVGVIICVPLLDEIRQLVKEIEGKGWPKEWVSIHTSDAEINKLGGSSSENAQLLITTQQMVESKLKDGKSFADIDAFHYKGKPRQVKIWDEALIPWEELTLSIDDIAGLPRMLRRYNSGLATSLHSIVNDLSELEDGDSYTVPDFEAEYGFNYEDARRELFASRDQQLTDRHYVYTLSRLSGKTVRVVQDIDGLTLISWRQQLPDDFMPVVVFDASGKVRTIYEQYAKTGGQLKPITYSEKRFDNVTFHHVNIGAGKNQWKKDAGKLLDATAACINNEPDRPALVVHHLPEQARRWYGYIPDIPKVLPDLLNGTKVDFLSWGKHKHTNDYKDYDKLVLAGLLYLPASVVEVRTRGAMRLPDEAIVADDQYAAIEIGELKNDILQAVGRICVRKCDGDQAPKADIYIMASNKAGHSTIAELLKSTFPGCEVKGFGIPGEAKERWEQALEFIADFYSKPENAEILLPIKDVREAIGLSNTSNYNRLVRDNSYFQVGLKDLLVVSVGSGTKTTHYRKLPF